MKLLTYYLLLIVGSSSVAGVLIYAQTPRSVTPQLLLREAKEAVGGNRWDAIQEIDSEGEKTSLGLSGHFRSQDQFATGFFTHQATYSIFSNAEGFDRAGRWRMDNSGQIHALDSEEARTVALSESYISRWGYFYPEQYAATFNDCQLPSRPQQACVWIIPKGGRAMALWINVSTHHIERIEMELSVGAESFEYGDYRRVDGLSLPYTVTVDHGGESDSGSAHISTYHLTTVRLAAEIHRPRAGTDVVEMRPGAMKTTMRGYLDRRSGFFMVEAKINGEGPYPFILDTGGHDILTPDMAHRLGLSAVGKGFSTGAGAGSTPTEFTSVSTLTIGDATMHEQPFTILHIDLGSATRAQGKSVSIAGILGLEVFERFAITMNYKEQTVTFTPNENFEYHGRGTAVPLQFTSDMPLCVASMSGQSGLFGLDTGNNTEVIVYHPWAVAKGFIPSTLTTGMAGTSVGGALKLAKGHIANFTIGGFDLGPIDVLFSSDTSGSLSAKAEAGNVGNSVLSQFTVTFSYGSGKMYLEREGQEKAANVQEGHL